jgi:hypothetical protein
MKTPNELPFPQHVAIALRLLRKEGLTELADQIEGRGQFKDLALTYHFYERIPGWFVYYDLYKNIVAYKPNAAHVVEVGAGQGRGAAFFLVEACRAKKKMRFDSVCQPAAVDLLLKNTEQIRSVMMPVLADPLDSARLYADDSLDAVMLGDVHLTEESLKEWYLKLKPGGWLAGANGNEAKTASVLAKVFESVHLVGSWPAWKVVKGLRERSVTIVVTAFKIDDQRIAEFFTWNTEVFQKYGVKVILVADRKVEVNYPNVTVMVMPNTQPFYSLARGVNYGVKRTENTDPDGGLVIKTDVDIVIGDALMEYALARVETGQAMMGSTFYVNSVNDVPLFGKEGFQATQSDSARGGFVALTRNDWFKLHGFDERMYGWGYEDNDLLKRAKMQMKVEETEWLPLFHIAHQKRDASIFPVRVENNRAVSDGMWAAHGAWGEG